MVRKIIVSVSLVGVAAGAIFLVSTSTGRNVPPEKPPVPSVTVAAVEERRVVELDEFTGRTESVETVEVRPRVSGHIEDVCFRSGALVKKGDILFTIDARWHRAEFNRRQAEFAQAKARLENAEREARRTNQLLTNRAISAEEAEARQSRFTEAQGALLAAEAARDSAKLDLDFTEIRAPINGQVSRALVTAGNYVSGIPGAASLLTTLVSVDPIYVYADMDEQSLLRFKRIGSNAIGDKIPVELQLANETSYPRRGYVESLNNRVDANTGSILLRAVFPNPDGAIVPGLFARIRVPLSDEHSALLVEERAIGTDQGQKFVLALSSTNTVQYRSVKLGPLVDGKRIVRSGLAAGDQIIVNGLQRVRPGMPVVAETAVASSKALETARR
jgi:RND family efflux transporter MFP subunit